MRYISLHFTWRILEHERSRWAKLGAQAALGVFPCLTQSRTQSMPVRRLGLLYCIVLYCIVLYCIVLYCIVLYCIVLYLISLETLSSSAIRLVFMRGVYLAIYRYIKMKKKLINPQTQNEYYPEHNV
jgi:hypothetical protein